MYGGKFPYINQEFIDEIRCSKALIWSEFKWSTGMIVSGFSDVLPSKYSVEQWYRDDKARSFSAEGVRSPVSYPDTMGVRIKH